MLYRMLAVGDVVGEAGLRHLEKQLRPLRRLRDIAFVVVNGENAAGVGLTPAQAQRIYDAGADAVTLGNHTFNKLQIKDFLEETSWLLRPANYTGRAPGHGCEIFDLNGLRFRVVHAEATSEKLAMGYYLDGRVSALWGTDTHVPTADDRVYPKGTGYLTDVGMTGPVESVLGVEPEQSVENFLGGVPGHFRTAEGPCKLQGAIFTLDSSTGLCTAVERIEIR